MLNFHTERSTYFSSVKMNISKALSKIYYKPGSQGAFSGADNLMAAFKKLYPNHKITKKAVLDFLSKQTAYSLHRKHYKKFSTNPMFFPRVNHQLSCDLIDFHSLSQYNDGYKYILVAIDGLSRYTYTEKLKAKTGIAIRNALIKIFDRCFEIPKVMNSDLGTEFTATTVQKLLKSKNIHFFTSHGETKASNVERVIKTLKEILYRYFDKTLQRHWVDILPQITKTYNQNYHRIIKMTPEEAQELPNALKLSAQSHSQKANVTREPAYLKKGDIVRLNLNLGPLAKKYEQAWSRALYRVTSDARYSAGGPRPMYEISELNGTPIKGRFYPEEVLKVDKKTFLDEYDFPIEKVVEKGRKESKVKWLGYPTTYDSWVKNSAIKHVAH